MKLITVALFMNSTLVVSALSKLQPDGMCGMCATGPKKKPELKPAMSDQQNNMKWVEENYPTYDGSSSHSSSNDHFFDYTVPQCLEDCKTTRDRREFLKQKNELRKANKAVQEGLHETKNKTHQRGEKLNHISNRAERLEKKSESFAQMCQDLNK